MTDEQKPPNEPGRHQFDVEEVELDTDVAKEIQEQAIAHESRYATLGLIVGAAALVGGAVLIVLGFAGEVDIIWQKGDTKGRLTTGSLGIVVVLVGAAIIYMTRFRVRISGRREDGG